MFVLSGLALASLVYHVQLWCGGGAEAARWVPMARAVDRLQ